MTKTAMEMIAEARSTVGTVTPGEAARELDAGRAVALDVREAEEWQHGHIDGSVPAPRGLLSSSPTHPALATRTRWTLRVG
jgi:rhodanese-related sulfurtransferase